MSTEESITGFFAIRYPDGRFYPGNGMRIFTDKEYPKWLIASQRVMGDVVQITEIKYAYLNRESPAGDLGGPVS